MTHQVPEGYLGAEGQLRSGPAPELVEAGYALETADAPLLHDGLTVADLAHVVALVEAGVVAAEAVAPLLRALLDLLATGAADFPYDPVYGDAYNSRERELERRLGPAAGWLAAGRTRREAGRIAFRLALRRELLALHDAVCGFASATLDLAAGHAETVWADLTYLQPAQPSSFGHYLGAFAEEAVRHLDRLEAAYRWVDVSPGGVGGTGGTRLPVDRDRLTELLGFAATGGHARDVMWSVDGLAEVVLAACQAALTVDRLAEDLEAFTSPRFGYVRLDASLCRASVLLPQKRNPYALAVLRGGAGTLAGRLAGVVAASRTPSARTDNWLYAYGEVSGAVQLARRLVALGAEVVRTLQVDTAALARDAAAGFTGAADLAEELVLRTGLDYRSAYRMVARAAAGGDGLTARGLAAASGAVLGTPIVVDDALLAAVLDPAQAVAARSAPGGAAPHRVRERCAQQQVAVDAARQWALARRTGNETARAALLAAVGELLIEAPAGRVAPP